MNNTERTLSSPNFAQLSTYEEWAAQNWLHQIGTDDAQLHARAKLDEEIAEFHEALTDTNNDNIISEAGDVLWTASAVGINTDISLSSALAYTFPHIFKADEISSEHIDTTATQLYGGISVREMNAELLKNGNAASKYTKQWFRLRHILTTETPHNFAEAITWTKHHRSSIGLARLVLLTSYSLQEFAGSTIQAAMQDNYQKIERRIATGAAVTKAPRA